MSALSSMKLLAKPLPHTCTSGRHSLRASNGTEKFACMAKKHVFNVEITVPEGENQDQALRTFRRAVVAANIIPEVRRRQRFENPQDAKKRKMKEMHIRRARQKLYRTPTYDEVVGGTEPAPFADMFGDPDDIFAEDGGILLDPIK